MSAALNKGNPLGVTGNSPMRSTGRAGHQPALAALRAHAVFPDESTRARDAGRRAVTGRRVDPTRAPRSARSNRALGAPGGTSRPCLCDHEYDARRPTESAAVAGRPLAYRRLPDAGPTALAARRRRHRRPFRRGSRGDRGCHRSGAAGPETGPRTSPCPRSRRRSCPRVLTRAAATITLRFTTEPGRARPAPGYPSPRRSR